MFTNGMATSTAEKVDLYSDYKQLIDSRTQRGRQVSQVEAASPQKMMMGDIREANGIVQLYLKGTQLAARSLLEKKFERFDAAIGDHNCHLTYVVLLDSQNDPALCEEAKQLLMFAKSKIGKTQFSPKGPQSPLVLIKEKGCEVTLSDTMKYLVYNAILRVGTTCLEYRDGSMTLKTEPSNIQKNIAKTCSVDLIQRLVTPFKEYINRFSVAFVQRVAQQVLKEEERVCMTKDCVKMGITPRGEKFEFPCAFYNMKASLLTMVQRGIPFVVVQYDHDRIVRHPLLVFGMTESETDEMKRIDVATLSAETTVFVIQVFFNETLEIEEIGNRLEEYGLIELTLANIAVNPQFADMKKSEYLNNEDIQELPEERQREIMRYRQEGVRLGLDTATPEICRMAHIYADSLKNIKQKL